MTLALAVVVVLAFLAGGLLGSVLMCGLFLAKSADGPDREAVYIPGRPVYVIRPPSNPGLVEGWNQEDEARSQAMMQAELARKWRADFDR